VNLLKGYGNKKLFKEFPIISCKKTYNHFKATDRYWWCRPQGKSDTNINIFNKLVLSRKNTPHSLITPVNRLPRKWD